MKLTATKSNGYNHCHNGHVFHNSKAINGSCPTCGELAHAGYKSECKVCK